MGQHLVSFPSLYVKFDLTAETLAGCSILSECVNREAAIRASLIVWTDTPNGLTQACEVSLHPDVDYVVIKAPTLDGNEIWIFAKELQIQVERAAGFDVISVPLMTLKAASLHLQTVRHPLSDHKVPIQISHQVTLQIGTGIVLKSAPLAEKIYVETVIAKLRRQGDLVAYLEAGA